MKTSSLGNSKIYKVWGEGGHNAGKNSEKIFFQFLKKKIFLTTKLPIFGSNLGQFGLKWVIFEFLTKKRTRHFFEKLQF